MLKVFCIDDWRDWSGGGGGGGASSGLPGEAKWLRTVGRVGAKRNVPPLSEGRQCRT